MWEEILICSCLYLGLFFILPDSIRNPFTSKRYILLTLGFFVALILLTAYGVHKLTKRVENFQIAVSDCNNIKCPSTCMFKASLSSSGLLTDISYMNGYDNCLISGMDISGVHPSGPMKIESIINSSSVQLNTSRNDYALTDNNILIGYTTPVCYANTVVLNKSDQDQRIGFNLYGRYVRIYPPVDEVICTFTATLSADGKFSNISISNGSLMQGMYIFGTNINNGVILKVLNGLGGQLATTDINGAAITFDNTKRNFTAKISDGTFGLSHVMIYNAKGENISYNRSTSGTKSTFPSAGGAGSVVDGNYLLYDSITPREAPNTQTPSGAKAWGNSNTVSNRDQNYWEVDLGSREMVNIIRIISPYDYGDTKNITRGGGNRVKGLRIAVLENTSQTPDINGTCAAYPIIMYPTLSSGAQITDDEKKIIGPEILKGIDGEKALLMYRLINITNPMIQINDLKSFLSDEQILDLYKSTMTSNIVKRNSKGDMTPSTAQASRNLVRNVLTINNIPATSGTPTEATPEFIQNFPDCMNEYREKNAKFSKRPKKDGSGKVILKGDKFPELESVSDNGIPALFSILVSPLIPDGQDNSGLGYIEKGVTGTTVDGSDYSEDGLERDNLISAISQQSATFEGYISGTTLTVTNLKSGKIAVGMNITGKGINLNTNITGRGTGNGSTGTYTINPAGTAGSAGSVVLITASNNTAATPILINFTGSISGTTLNVSVMNSEGNLAPNLYIFGSDILPETMITGMGSGTGGTGTYTVNIQHTTASAAKSQSLKANSNKDGSTSIGQSGPLSNIDEYLASLGFQAPGGDVSKAMPQWYFIKGDFTYDQAETECAKNGDDLISYKNLNAAKTAGANINKTGWIKDEKDGVYVYVDTLEKIPSSRGGAHCYGMKESHWPAAELSVSSWTNKIANIKDGKVRPISDPLAEGVDIYNTYTPTTASFIGSISGTILTVTDITVGPIPIGASISGSGVAPETIITTQLTQAVGSTELGELGTYQVSLSQNVPSTGMLGNRGEWNKRSKNEPMKNKEVFHIYPYRFTKQEAQDMCLSMGADLATYDQMMHAFNGSAQWCSTGWLKDKDVPYYPMQEIGISGCSNNLTSPTLIQYGSSGSKAGANCYGIKPSNIVYSFTLTNTGRINANTKGRFVRILNTKRTTASDIPFIWLTQVLIKDSDDNVISKNATATQHNPTNDINLSEYPDGATNIGAQKLLQYDTLQQPKPWNEGYASKSRSDDQFVEIDLGKSFTISTIEIVPSQNFGFGNTTDRATGLRVIVSTSPAILPFSNKVGAYAWNQTSLNLSDSCGMSSDGVQKYKKICNIGGGRTIDLCVTDTSIACDQICIGNKTLQGKDCAIQGRGVPKSQYGVECDISMDFQRFQISYLYSGKGNPTNGTPADNPYHNKNMAAVTVPVFDKCEWLNFDNTSVFRIWANRDRRGNWKDSFGKKPGESLSCDKEAYLYPCDAGWSPGTHVDSNDKFSCNHGTFCDPCPSGYHEAISTPGSITCNADRPCAGGCPRGWAETWLLCTEPSHCTRRDGWGTCWGWSGGRTWGKCDNDVVWAQQRNCKMAELKTRGRDEIILGWEKKWNNRSFENPIIWSQSQRDVSAALTRYMGGIKRASLTISGRCEGIKEKYFQIESMGINHIRNYARELSDHNMSPGGAAYTSLVKSYVNSADIKGCDQLRMFFDNLFKGNLAYLLQPPMDNEPCSDAGPVLYWKTAANENGIGACRFADGLPGWTAVPVGRSSTGRTFMNHILKNGIIAAPAPYAYNHSHEYAQSTVNLQKGNEWETDYIPMTSTADDAKPNFKVISFDARCCKTEDAIYEVMSHIGAAVWAGQSDALVTSYFGGHFYEPRHVIQACMRQGDNPNGGVWTLNDNNRNQTRTFATPVIGRYVRVRPGSGNTLQFKQIVVKDPAGNKMGDRVYATTEHRAASNAYNGIGNSLYQGAKTGHDGWYNEFWEVDFGSNKLIGSIEYWGPDNVNRIGGTRISVWPSEIGWAIPVDPFSPIEQRKVTIDRMVEAKVIDGTVKNYSQCVTNSDISAWAYAAALPGDDGAVNRTRFRICAPYFNNSGWNPGDTSDDRKGDYKTNIPATNR
jgi:hypothetical protein